jgi:hypothetical protein
MTFQPGRSGNPAGGKRGPRARPAQIRKMISDSSVDIVRSIINAAKLGDIAAQQLFCRYLLPRQRFVAMSVEMPVIDGLEVARAQIARLAVLAGAGDLDLDSMTSISKTIALAAGLRLEELEDILADREDETARVRHDH